MAIENGYCLGLNKWILDNTIENELRLLLIISSLTARDGFCYASNSYFAKLFDSSEETISRKIKKLEKKKYIKIKYEFRGAEIKKREIRLTSTIDKNINRRQKYQSSIDENINRTIDENVKDNNISINNININNNINIPTIADIENYCKLCAKKIDIQTFYDYWSAVNWCDKSGLPIRSWKQKVISWWKIENSNTSIKSNTASDKNKLFEIAKSME